MFILNMIIFKKIFIYLIFKYIGNDLNSPFLKFKIAEDLFLKLAKIRRF